MPCLRLERSLTPLYLHPGQHFERVSQRLESQATPRNCRNTALGATAKIQKMCFKGTSRYHCWFSPSTESSRYHFDLPCHGSSELPSVHSFTDVRFIIIVLVLLPQWHRQLRRRASQKAASSLLRTSTRSKQEIKSFLRFSFHWDAGEFKAYSTKCIPHPFLLLY